MRISFTTLQPLLFFCLYLKAAQSSRPTSQYPVLDPLFYEFGYAPLCLEAEIGRSKKPDSECLKDCWSVDENKCRGVIIDNSKRECIRLSRACNYYMGLASDYTIFMKPPGNPSILKWRRGTQSYALFPELETPNEIGNACGLYGMYQWNPDSKAENDFVKNTIVKSLPDKYFSVIPDYSVRIAKFFIGIMDGSDGQCFLLDGSECSFMDFHENEPNRESEECVMFAKIDKPNEEFKWIDYDCSIKTYPFCEGKYPE